MTLEDLRTQALRLDLRSRAALAEALLESLEFLNASEAQQLALDEAERRQAQVHSGAVAMVPGDLVFERLSKAVG